MLQLTFLLLCVTCSGFLLYVHVVKLVNVFIYLQLLIKKSTDQFPDEHKDFHNLNSSFAKMINMVLIYHYISSALIYSCTGLDQKSLNLEHRSDNIYMQTLSPFVSLVSWSLKRWCSLREWLLSVFSDWWRILYFADTAVLMLCTAALSWSYDTRPFMYLSETQCSALESRAQRGTHKNHLSSFNML